MIDAEVDVDAARLKSRVNQSTRHPWLVLSVGYLAGLGSQVLYLDLVPN
jgi:hypothetical protein